jgi:hypothetical protein
MATPLITDEELLALGVAETALNKILEATRDIQREAASDYVRSKLAPRYSVFNDNTLSSVKVSYDVKLAVAAVAAYHLLGRRGFNPSKGSEAQIKARYDVAEEWLEDMRTAKAELVTGGTVNKGGVLVGGTNTGHWENWRQKCLKPSVT